MTKIVYNGSYGGFGLSEKAVQRYSDLAGLGLTYKKHEDSPWSNWYTPDGECWREYDLDRADPLLVQVVEELGEEANGLYARLDIMDLPKGTLYRIDEYDGMETVMTQDDYDWSVA
jgi:hypothetical protein